MDNPCLLVVDDDPKITHLLQIALRRGGYEIWASHSGEEAIDLARRERPDAVLLDLCMPDMSGEDVLHYLKTDAELSDVPVIVATGETDFPELAGAYAILTKPFNLRRLYRTLDRALAG
ncbi:MAG: response regulator [Armatimonadia bacterium]|nr:response regulator [Armatimonadia bacterium]